MLRKSNKMKDIQRTQAYDMPDDSVTSKKLNIYETSMKLHQRKDDQRRSNKEGTRKSVKHMNARQTN